MVEQSARVVRHGVVFVHGLGEQSKSETLLWFGRPLVDWLARWYEARGEPGPTIEPVTLGFTPFDPGEPDFQPRARLRLGPPDGAQETWVLTEAWWAASNLRPDFWSMVYRSWRYLWIAVIQLLNAAWRRLGRTLKPKEHSTDPGRLVLAVDFVNTLLAAVGYFIAGVAGYLILIPLIALSRVPLPGLQDFVLVRLLRPLLQMQVGEFTAYLEDELQAANMRRRVAESIRWLVEPEPKGGGCDDVTVIAHSGGAIVSFGALTDKALCETGAPLADGRFLKVRKLITVGAGLNKAWLFYPTLKRMHGPLPKHMHWLDIWTAYDPVPAGPLTPKLDGRWAPIFDPAEAVIKEQGLEKRAGPDPRATGAGDDASRRYWPVSEEVTNRMAVLVDHGLYWTNDEQVLVRLAAEIDAPFHQNSRFWRGAGQLLPEEGRTQALKDAIRDRRTRVAWLAAVRSLILGAALVVAVAASVAGLTRPEGALGAFLSHFLLETWLFQPVSAPLDAFSDWLLGVMQGGAPQAVWVVDVVRAVPVVLLGSLVVNLPLIILYLILGKIWDTIDAAARRRAVERIARAESAPAKPGDAR